MTLNISSFSIIHLIAFIINLIIIVFLIYRNPKALENRLCMIAIFTCSLWSLGYVFLSSSISPESAVIWQNISFIGGLGMPIAGLYFYLAVTLKTGVMKNKILISALSIICAFLLFQQFQNQQIFSPTQTVWGWICFPTGSVIYWFFLLFCELLFFICIAIVFHFLRKTTVIREKMQARWLGYTLIGSILTGTLTNSIFPLLHMPEITQFGEIAYFIWEFGIIVAVTKYGLMTVTPKTASDTILDTMGDALFLLDTRGIITMVNKAAITLLQQDKFQITGRRLESLFLENKDVPDIINQVREKGFSLNNELNCVTLDNKNISLLVSISCVKDHLKTTIGFVAVAKDITNRKKLEQELVELYAKEKEHCVELEEEAKERSIFINILAHELRTPLTPMLTSGSLLLDILKTNSSDIKYRLINNVYQGALMMQKRLDELLDVARYSRGAFQLNIQPCDLKEMFNRIISIFEPSLQESDQTLITDIPAILPAASIDSSRIEQVIINLLSNASKYSPRGKNIHFKASVSDNFLKVEVEDEGIGIPEEEVMNLFKPYHRLHKDKNIPGLGLGLSVCKQIIEAHKGLIYVTSRQGQGSIFSFTVPITVNNVKVTIKH